MTNTGIGSFLHRAMHYVQLPIRNRISKAATITVNHSDSLLARPPVAGGALEPAE
jgi:hypothetical protein